MMLGRGREIRRKQEPSLPSLNQETSLEIITFFLLFLISKTLRDGLRDPVNDGLNAPLSSATSVVLSVQSGLVRN